MEKFLIHQTTNDTVLWILLVDILSSYLLLLLRFFLGAGKLKVEAESPMIGEKCIQVF